MSQGDYRGESAESSARLDSVFNSLAAFLRGFGAPGECFVVSLIPNKWAIQYSALDSILDQTPDLDAFFADQVGLLPTKGLHALQARISELRTEFSNASPKEFFGAAVRHLEKTIVPLGWKAEVAFDCESGQCNLKEYDWVLTRGGSAPLKFFQVILSCSDGNHKCLGEKVVVYSDQVVLEVPRYLEAGKLVTDPSSLCLFLAEYLYSVKGRISEEVPPSSLSHYFVPIRGLGQLRAAVCWIAPGDQSKAFIPSITLQLRSAVEQMYSQHLVYEFGVDLTRALSLNQTGLDGVYEVFSGLWWADEVGFFSGQQCVCRYLRRPDGQVRPVNTADGEIEPYQPKMWYTIEQIDTRSDIILSFDFLSKQHGPQSDASKAFTFDHVVWRAPFARRDDEFVEFLRRRIEEVVNLRSAREGATRTKVAEAVAHYTKNALTRTGWTEALNGLRQLSPKEKSEPVKRAIESLSLLTLIDGTTNLQRLASIRREGNFEKLTDWIDDGQMARWEAGGATLGTHYAQFVSHIVCMLCFASRLTGCFILSTEFGRTYEEKHKKIEPPKLFDILGWTREYGALPPLSVRNDADSHIALLAALLEPLNNAINALRDFEKSYGGDDVGLHVHVVFTPKGESEGVWVYVGNEARQKPLLAPPGLVQMKELLSLTSIARIEPDRPPKGVKKRGATWYWVAVLLHPHKLAEEITDWMRRIGEE